MKRMVKRGMMAAMGGLLLGGAFGIGATCTGGCWYIKEYVRLGVWTCDCRKISAEGACNCTELNADSCLSWGGCSYAP